MNWIHFSWKNPSCTQRTHLQLIIKSTFEYSWPWDHHLLTVKVFTPLHHNPSYSSQHKLTHVPYEPVSHLTFKNHSEELHCIGNMLWHSTQDQAECMKYSGPSRLHFGELMKKNRVLNDWCMLDLRYGKICKLPFNFIHWCQKRKVTMFLLFLFILKWLSLISLMKLERFTSGRIFSIIFQMKGNYLNTFVYSFSFSLLWSVRRLWFTIFLALYVNL